MTDLAANTEPKGYLMSECHSMAGDNEFLNVFEASALLGVHDQTLRKLARQKRIPAFKVGKEWRFRREALIQWADEQGQEAEEERIECSVLVIDDEENVCKAMAGALKRIGCQATCTTRAAQGLELVKEDEPDLILLDLKMPNMNGPQFLARLRDTHLHLPEVIVTGYPESDLMLEAAQYAPIMLLSKPMEHEPLERTIRSFLGEKLPATR